MSGYNFLSASDGTGNAVLAHVTIARLVGSTVLKVDSVSKWNTGGFIATIGTVGADGFFTPGTVTEITGHITAGDIIIDGFEPGSSDLGNTVGQAVVVKQTTGWANSMVSQAQVGHNDDGTHKSTAMDAWFRLSEMTSDFVVSGGAVAQSSLLLGTMSDIIYYIGGKRYAITGIANKTYTINKDTYVDVNTSGAVVYPEVAVNAAAPALAANHKRIAMVRTNGTTITWVQQVGYDSNGVRFYNTVMQMPSFCVPVTGGSTLSWSASADQAIKTCFAKPRDIMTVGGKQIVRWQPYIRVSGGGQVCYYRNSYIMRPGAAYVGLEPTSGTTVGSTANYQILTAGSEVADAQYWADYDLFAYTFQDNLRVDPHRDGASVNDTAAGGSEMESCVLFYNKDYTKA